jgi:hypothetical protein
MQSYKQNSREEESRAFRKWKGKKRNVEVDIWELGDAFNYTVNYETKSFLICGANKTQKPLDNIDSQKYRTDK